MPINPLEMFDIGQTIGKNKKSSMLRAADYAVGEYGKTQDERRKYQVPLNPLEEARRSYLISQTRRNEGGLLSPSLQKQKNIATSDLLSMVETNKIKRDQIDRAKSSLSSLPKGFLGKVQTDYMRNFEPDNPILSDWQNLKTVLTDAQLMNVAKTKGAISDREMELFAQAASNDDLVSVSRMTPTLERLSRFMDAQEKSAIESYRSNYGEDPTQGLYGNTIQNASRNQSPIQRQKLGSVQQDYNDLVESLISSGMEQEEAMAQADKEFNL